MIVYVVATFTAGTIFTKRSTIETYALRDFIEACAETPDRVVMFEMEWRGVYDKVGVHQTAYAKALNGDFVAIEERAALVTTEVKVEAPEPSLEERVVALEAELSKMKINLKWLGINV